MLITEPTTSQMIIDVIHSWMTNRNQDFVAVSESLLQAQGKTFTSQEDLFRHLRDHKYEIIADLFEFVTGERCAFRPDGVHGRPDESRISGRYYETDALAQAKRAGVPLSSLSRVEPLDQICPDVFRLIMIGLSTDAIQSESESDLRRMDVLQTAIDKCDRRIDYLRLQGLLTTKSNQETEPRKIAAPPKQPWLGIVIDHENRTIRRLGYQYTATFLRNLRPEAFNAAVGLISARGEVVDFIKLLCDQTPENRRKIIEKARSQVKNLAVDFRSCRSGCWRAVDLSKPAAK